MDPYFDTFNKLTYEAICEFFRDVGTEPLRLEFEENINSEELAPSRGYGKMAKGHHHLRIR